MSSNNVSLNFERRDCLNEWLHNRKLWPFFMEEQAENEFNHQTHYHGILRSFRMKQQFGETMYIDHFCCPYSLQLHNWKRNRVVKDKLQKSMSYTQLSTNHLLELTLSHHVITNIMSTKWGETKSIYVFEVSFHFQSAN